MSARPDFRFHFVGATGARIYGKKNTNVLRDGHWDNLNFTILYNVIFRLVQMIKEALLRRTFAKTSDSEFGSCFISFPADYQYLSAQPFEI